MTSPADWIAEHPVESLLELRAALRDGRPVDPALSVWLGDAITRWMDGTGTLDDLLGLASPGPGRSPPLAAWRIEQQDQALADALDALGADVRALAAALARFESSRWLRWRRMGAPPERATPIERALFRALALGPVPSSQKQLRRRLGAGTLNRLLMSPPPRDSGSIPTHPEGT